jgi:hypothetical protein
MAFQAESPMKSLFARPIEAWVWPMTAAIVLGGSILFWSFAGLFWLATHPTERSVVIWMTPDVANTEARHDALIPKATFDEGNR